MEKLQNKIDSYELKEFNRCDGEKPGNPKPEVFRIPSGKREKFARKSRAHQQLDQKAQLLQQQQKTRQLYMKET